jgi:hypothetical protein
MKSDIKNISDVVVSQLDDGLRRAPWRGSLNYLAGHCYIASEAIYHLSGGKSSGLVPQYIKVNGISHWYLKYGNKIIDPTAGQFNFAIDYSNGVGRGFLTSEPSSRARILIDRVKRRLND